MWVALAVVFSLCPTAAALPLSRNAVHVTMDAQESAFGFQDRAPSPSGTRGRAAG
jgi:hypothetical protein